MSPRAFGTSLAETAAALLLFAVWVVVMVWRAIWQRS